MCIPDSSRLLFAALMAGVMLAMTPFVRAAEITVFAAASLTDALKQIASSYEKQSGGKILFNFAASSFLERQIEEGAPADIFFSADEAKMDALEKKGLIVAKSRHSRLSNSLVIVIASDSKLAIHTPQDLARPDIKRIALADTRTVPAGIYAKASLEKLKLWPKIESRIIPTDNVRAALAAVESGNVDAAMVYSTDAAISKKVKAACAIPPEATPQISYPIALVKDSKVPEAAGKFLTYLDSQDSARVFEQYGFIVRNPRAHEP